MENIFIDYWWYWLIAVIISAFQGYRGFIAQLQSIEMGKLGFLNEKKSVEFNVEANPELHKLGNDKNREVLKAEWMKVIDDKFIIYAKTNCQAVCLRAIPYCFFYFITTFLGFVSLFFVYYILMNTCNLNDISGGTAALIIFAVLYGIIGITGQLPSLIEQGKFPK